MTPLSVAEIESRALALNLRDSARDMGAFFVYERAKAAAGIRPGDGLAWDQLTDGQRDKFLSAFDAAVDRCAVPAAREDGR